MSNGGELSVECFLNESKSGRDNNWQQVVLLDIAYGYTHLRFDSHAVHVYE